MLKRLIPLVFVSFCCLISVEAAKKDHQKMYIDEDEFNTIGDAFHIHVGNNMWLETKTVHRDETGMYAYQSQITHSPNGPYAAYEKKWRCPYCYSYWPIGKPCANPDCPSKYRE